MMLIPDWFIKVMYKLSMARIILNFVLIFLGSKIELYGQKEKVLRDLCLQELCD